MGWSKAGWWWDTTQSMISPSGLCNKTNMLTTLLRRTEEGCDQTLNFSNSGNEYLNYLNRGLVDLLETSSYGSQLVDLLVWAKRLIHHFWWTNDERRRTNQRCKKKKKEMYKIRHDWSWRRRTRAQTPAKIHAWEISALSSHNINLTKLRVIIHILHRRRRWRRNH